MKTTSHTARLAELIKADKAEYSASKTYRCGMLEGGEGYNPHDSPREEIGKEIARLSILDIAELIKADKAEYSASKTYRCGMLEGGEGYNPHDSPREEIGKEIARLSILDIAERAESLTADETATIRAWVNSNKFGSASAADNALRDKSEISLDGLKAAMARHGIA